MGDSPALVDTNVLLSATTPRRRHYENATRVINEWPARGVRLCTSGQIQREYLVVATRPLEANGLGLTLEQAIENVDALKARMRFLEENQAVTARLREIVESVQCTGKQIHDANIVATAVAHGVERVLTANSAEFSRYRAFVEIVSLAES